MDAVLQQTNYDLRRTYDQLVETRNRQLRYMAMIRKEGGGGGGNGLGNLAFLVTPDLICQYNYVHRLMKSLQAKSSALPPKDICTADGGIMCSNLEVFLTPEQAVAGAGDPKRRFPASYDGADYIASRIIDLLDRPITATGEEADSAAMLVNTRDEFAANIRTLAILFEERYRLCRERGDRLQEKLGAAARAPPRYQVQETALVLEPSPTTDTVEDRTVLAARERANRYETQLREVGERLDALRVTNENTVQRGRHLVTELNRRVANLSDGMKTIGEAYSRVVHSLFAALESERERMAAIARRTRQDELAAASATAATLSREYEERCEREVSSRVAAVERSMRDDMETELKRRTAAAAGDAAAAVVDQSKWTELGGVFKLKQSAFEKLPSPPRYALPNKDTIGPDANVRLVHNLYTYFELLFTRLWDLYRFMLIQSGYIDSLVSACESTTTAGRQRFKETVEKIMADRVSTSEQNENQLLATMHHIYEELPNMKVVARLENTIEGLKRELESRPSGVVVDDGGGMQQQQSASELSVQVPVLRSMVRRLQMHLKKYTDTEKSSSSGASRTSGDTDEKMVKLAVLDLERSYRTELQIDVRHAYNELVSFTQEVGTDFRRWFDQVNGNRKNVVLPAVLSNFDLRLKDMTTRADTKFNFAISPLSPKTGAATTAGAADGVKRSDTNRRSRTHPYWKSKQHHTRDRSAHRKRASR